VGGGVPNRGLGTRLVIQGAVTTRRGTPVVGDINVFQGGRRVAFVNLISGRYTIYDLDPGSYRLVVRAEGVDTAPRNVTVGLSPITVNFVSGASVEEEGGNGWTPQVLSFVPFTPTTPDLSTGTRLVAQGTATTRRGTPALGRIDIYRSGQLAGYASLTSGRYTIYDLPRGDHRLTFRPTGGDAEARNVTIGLSPITVNFVV